MFSKSEYEEIKDKIFCGRRRVYNDNLTEELLDLFHKETTFNGLSIKRNNLSDIIFNRKRFFHVSFAGTIFKNVTFFNSKLEILHAQGCKFYNTKFLGTLKTRNISCDYNGSFFQCCVFENIIFDSCSFLECIFWECRFVNCTFRSSTFENAVFTECKLEHVDMTHLNIEYATFTKSIIKNCRISFFQLPYINCIFSCLDKNNIIVANEHLQTFEEYCKNIKSAITYFTYERQYFPLISLYLFQSNKALAKAAMKVGIETALVKMDIRTIDFYCNAGLLNGLLSNSELKELFEKINQHLESDSSIETKYNKILFSGIRRHLIYSEISPHMEITIQTGICENCLNDVGMLCNEIDNVIEKNGCKAIYNISHNSDPQLVVEIIGVSIAGLVLLKDLIKDILDAKKKQLVDKESDKKVVKTYNIVVVNSTIHIDD